MIYTESFIQKIWENIENCKDEHNDQMYGCAYDLLQAIKERDWTISKIQNSLKECISLDSCTVGLDERGIYHTDEDGIKHEADARFVIVILTRYLKKTTEELKKTNDELHKWRTGRVLQGVKEDAHSDGFIEGYKDCKSVIKARFIHDANVDSRALIEWLDELDGDE